MTLGEITVLHVDDEPGFAEMVHAFLERERESLRVVTETSAAAGLERLTTESIDCVVSDFDMPQMDGLEFLREVRAEHPELPFVLFTAQGSEEIAANAISAGVSDYLQKGTGAEQYVVLANRIENLVEMYRAEQRTLATRRRFTRLIEDAAELISVVDGTGTFTYVSPASEPVLGYRPDELEGTNAFDYVHPEDTDRTFELFEELLGDGTSGVVADIRLRHADGSWVWVENRGNDLRADPDVGGVVVYTRDITDRRERDRWFEGLVKNSTDTITVVEAEGTVTYESPAAVHVKGIEPASFVGSNVLKCVHPDDVARVETAFEPLLTGDRSFVGPVEYRFSADGTDWQWLESFGSRPDAGVPVDGFIVNSRNVTERHEQERRLRDYEAIVEHMADVAYTVDETFAVSAVNPAVLAYAGVPREAIVGTDVRELSEGMVPDPDARRQFVTALEAVIGGDATDERLAFDIETPGGTVPAEVAISPLTADDSVVGAVVVSRDLSVSAN